MSFVGSNYKIYCNDISGDGSEFELVFERDGKIVDSIVENSFHDILIESNNFFCKNCEKYGVDTRYDTLVVELVYKF